VGVLAPVCAFGALEAAGPRAADLAFLAGCWRAEVAGRVVEEQWMAPAGGVLVGMGRTVAGEKVEQHEFLLVREQPDGVFYIASPSGQATASFKLVTLNQDEAVFENPAHDFPTRIRYRRVGPDALHARIEGIRNSQLRGIDFPYTRVVCAQ
jgi:hypothetical protein